MVQPMRVLAILASFLSACQPDDLGGGSVRPPADADADSDGDTDADADTDAGWDATGIGFDFEAPIVAAELMDGTTLNGTILRASFAIQLVDLYASEPRQCTVTYRVAGAPPAAGFDTTFLGAWDLSDFEVQDADGDCDTIQRLLGVPTTDVGASIRSLDFKVGIRPMTEVDEYTQMDWQTHWGGDWATEFPTMAALYIMGWSGSLTYPMNVIQAYEVDPITNEVVLDEFGMPLALPLSTATSLADGYYNSTPMYILSGS